MLVFSREASSVSIVPAITMADRAATSSGPTRAIVLVTIIQKMAKAAMASPGRKAISLVATSLAVVMASSAAVTVNSVRAAMVSSVRAVTASSAKAVMVSSVRAVMASSAVATVSSVAVMASSVRVATVPSAVFVPARPTTIPMPNTA